MSIIDSGPQPIFHVGDNRHSPLRIVDAALQPYVPRLDEHRKAEARIAPKLNAVGKITQRAREANARLQKQARKAKR